jgi:hypothetical protein
MATFQTSGQGLRSHQETFRNIPLLQLPANQSTLRAANMRRAIFCAFGQPLVQYLFTSLPS